jgi:type III secretion system FlhB-like substrate exporter
MSSSEGSVNLQAQSSGAAALSYQQTADSGPQLSGKGDEEEVVRTLL